MPRIRRPALLIRAFFALCLALAACGDGDTGASDAGAVADGSRADSGGDSSMGPTDASPDDASPEDAGIEDAARIDAGSRDAGPLTCDCDVTSLCDTDCACDIACTVVPGAPPLGGEAMLLARSEIAIYAPSASSASIDTVTLRDDGYVGPGGPTPTFAPIGASAGRPAMAVRPETLGADIDGDGREESAYATSSAIVVEDLGPGGLVPRTVHTYAPADSVEIAAGDLDGDNAPDLVVSHQLGSALTLEVLQLGATGIASVRGSATISSVARHAIAVARMTADGPHELLVLVAGTGFTGALEPLTLHRYTLGAALVEGTSSSLGGNCIVPSTPTDEGIALAAGNVDADAATGIAYATYCDDGTLDVALTELGGIAERWIGAPRLDSSVAVLGAFRPQLAIARVGATALARPMVVVGNTPTAGGASGPVATVTILEERIGSLRTQAEQRLRSSLSALSVLTDLAVRDVDRDGLDEIVAAVSDVALRSFSGGACSGFGCELHEQGWFVDVAEAPLDVAPIEIYRVDAGDARSIGPGVALAVGDFDADSIRVRSTGNVYLHTGTPFVNAVLAAPPTWLGRSDVVHGDSSSTSFGTSTSMGASDTRTINATASSTLSAGGSFGVVEFSASVSASVEFAASSSVETTVSYGTETSVGADADLVLFRAVPYASHEYRVVAHPSPAEIGNFITFDVPGPMIETVLTLAGFRAAYGSLADGIIPPNLFTHTIGDPTTYIRDGDCTQAALASRITQGTISDVGSSPTLVDVGNASSGARTQSITLGMQTGSSTEVNLSVEMSVGVGAAGVTAEVSAGVGAGFTHETTVGRDVTYTGSVSYISTGYGISSRYVWGLCVFHYADAGHMTPRGEAVQSGSFPVIDYVAQPY